MKKIRIRSREATLVSEYHSKSITNLIFVAKDPFSVLVACITYRAFSNQLEVKVLDLDEKELTSIHRFTKEEDLAVAR